MKVLIIGQGGREHAIAWKVSQSPLVKQVLVAPGNGGTALEPSMTNIDIAVTDIPALVEFAKKESIELTIVGPEAPLAAGLVDAFEAANLHCFGPTKAAATLESSKAFCKDFMKRHKIPNAASSTFNEIAPAIDYVTDHQYPLVIKADGLAAGKGVVIAQNREEAKLTIEDMLSGKTFGEAGSSIVIEDFLVGEELSYMAIVSNGVIVPFASSQDHKARDDGDLGPNTGGMGAYSPAPLMTAELEQRIIREVMSPVVEGIAQENAPYTGFLYAGLMISPEGNPSVLEFNCRLGDPETEPLMMRLASDLVPICLEACRKSLTAKTLSWRSEVALSVVLAADGYPGSYDRGMAIEGAKLSSTENQKIFHAGTVLCDNQLQTNGGRVLCVTALGDNVKEAQSRAYQLAASIHWDKMYYRKDIGHKAIAREENERMG